MKIDKIFFKGAIMKNIDKLIMAKRIENKCSIEDSYEYVIRFLEHMIVLLQDDMRLGTYNKINKTRRK